MIVEYQRPKTVQATLDLLSRTQPPTYPLGGGTVITKPDKREFAVVDLQDLELDTIQVEGNSLLIGAMVTLQRLSEYKDLHPAIARVIQLESTYNIRQIGTVAGSIVAADGRSLFTATLMAVDSRLIWLPGDVHTGIGDWLPLRKENLPGKLITQIQLPTPVKLACQSVSRTPNDWPQVFAAVARWPSGRTRVVLAGYGESPVIALDGTSEVGAEIAARNAYSHAEDAWASAEYRQSVAGILVHRCLQELE